MGNWNSGRRPFPSAVQTLRGNPGKRRPNAAEPKPPIAGPDFDTPPEELAGRADAIREWQRIVPLLRAIGVATVADRAVLIGVCLQWDLYLTGHRQLAAEGLVLAGTSGTPTLSPYLQVADRALAQCQRLWIELGLTPSSRTRLHAGPVTPAAGTGSKWDGEV